MAFVVTRMAPDVYIKCCLMRPLLCRLATGWPCHAGWYPRWCDTLYILLYQAVQPLDGDLVANLHTCSTAHACCCATAPSTIPPRRKTAGTPSGTGANLTQATSLAHGFAHGLCVHQPPCRLQAVAPNSAATNLGDLWEPIKTAIFPKAAAPVRHLTAPCVHVSHAHLVHGAVPTAFLQCRLWVLPTQYNAVALVVLTTHNAAGTRLRTKP